MDKIRKLIFALLLPLLLFNTIICNASTKTYDRNELENHGVKKNWVIDENNIDNVMNTKAVDASEKIYDFAEVLTEEEEKILKQKIEEFIEKNQMDLVIVTDKIPYPEEIKNYCYNDAKADKEEKEFTENYAADFYDYNDFGLDFKNNSGILLVRNTEIDPCYNAMYYDMLTFGNAQLHFTQREYDEVLDGIYDNLKSQDYLKGFEKFIDMTNNHIQSGIPREMQNYYIDENGDLQKHPDPPAVYKIPWPIVLSVSLVITIIVMSILIKKNKMVQKARAAGEYLRKESVKITNRQDVFINSHTTSYTTSSSSGSSGGGGFSSSHGSSGGGHSSGGGRHG